MLFIIGGTLFTVGMVGMGWNFENLDSEVLTFDSKTFNEPINAINIETHFNIEIKTSDVDWFEISYFYSNQIIATIEVVNNVLTVDIKRDTSSWHLWGTWFIGIRAHRATIKIMVPETFTQDITINNTAGATNLSGVVINNLTIGVTSGNVILNDIHVNQANINITSGALTLNYVNITDSFSSRITSGRTTINDTTANTMNIQSTSGRIIINNVTTNNIQTNVISGSTTLTNLRSNVIGLRSVSGSITGTINGVKPNYTIVITQTSGSSNLSNQQGNIPGYILSVQNTSGRIRLNFI